MESVSHVAPVKLEGSGTINPWPGIRLRVEVSAWIGFWNLENL